MKSNVSRAALAVSAFLITLLAGAQVPAKLSPADKDFVATVGSGNLAEVEIGKLAIANGASQGVKDFGERLVADHEKANLDLEKTVAVYGEALPTQMGAEHQRHHDLLTGKQGADFDAAFVRHMIKGHKRMISLFQNEAKHGGAEPLKQFAIRTLRTLEQHLQLATDLSKVKTSSL